MWQDVLAWVGVFLAAATPWVELIVVIPVGVAAGMHPVVVGVVAFAGNALPVGGIVLGHRSYTRWRDRRRGRALEREGGSVLVEEPSKRGWRRRFSDGALARYGVPGLALVAPVTTGIHLAAVLALGVGARRPFAAAWMIGSLALWTVVTTALAVGGLSLFG